MGIFKSREEKRIERDLEVRKGIGAIKRNLKDMDKHTKEYIDKAKKAKRIGDNDQLKFIKSALKKTALGKKMRERQLLSLETAMQIKNQAESDGEFARAMMEVSKSISEVYGATDLAKTQKNFERAMLQAETLQDRMQIVVESMSDTLATSDEDAEKILSDKDIDKMIDDEAVHEEKGELDKEIEKGLKEIEEEMGKES
ncbi:MAG: hypothetical protein FD180_3424 [Planctomycetota bacterium]|nr:MAG: hypothetical protein FD180_3424 [Planctomycetota bacterium]